MNDTYFVIYCNDSGDHYITPFTKTKLEEALAEEFWGSDIPIHKLDGFSQVNLECVYGLYIIKGQSIQPQPKQTVTRWEV
jgi:hypothetical protein